MSPWRNGVRPNSPPQMTSVSSSRPRCFRSLTSAADGWSVSRHWILSCVGQVAVLVPAGVHELDEPHAALGQPAGHQAVVGERALPLHVGAVHVEDVLRLVREVGQLRHARLHLDRPSRTGRCAWRSPGRRTRCSFSSLSLARSSSRPRRTSRLMPSGLDRYSTGSPLAAELHALVLRRQEAAAPVEVVEDLAARRLLVARGHDDERRQIVVRGCRGRRSATRPCSAGPAARAPVRKKRDRPGRG